MSGVAFPLNFVDPLQVPSPGAQQFCGVGSKTLVQAGSALFESVRAAMGKRCFLGEKQQGKEPKKPRKLHCHLGSQQCVNCYWMKHGSALQASCVLPDSDVSWLQAYESSDGLRVGCIACYKYCSEADANDLPSIASSPLAWFPVASLTGTLKNLKRHSACPGHQKAVAAFWDIPLEKPEIPEDAAPSKEQWASIWRSFRSKRYMDQESSELILREKGRRMQYCLAEALRVRHRQLLREAQCLTLSLDEAKTRLLVRFACVGKRLQVHRGVLGMHRSKATGHKSVMESLDHILRNSCTYLHGHPPPTGKTEPTFHEDLYEHLRSITRVWNSDAGPDEMLAAKEVQKIPLSKDDLSPLLPNIILVNRDKAHASRRVARRPWTAAEDLSQIFQTFSQWFSAVEHSSMLQGWYEEFQAQQQDEQKVTVQKSLAYAAHRFDSASRPFAVCLLTLPSCLLTAIKAVNERRGTAQAERARAFLEFVSGVEGAERLVLAGMLADASDEALLLIRAMDREACDTSLMHHEVQQFLRRTKWLFVDEQCVNVGFTQYMMEAIKTQHVWFEMNHPCTIGLRNGLSAAALRRCLQKMASWVGVSAKVVATEFPSFDLMGSFRALALPDSAGNDNSREQHCRGLAQQHAEEGHCLLAMIP